MRSSFPCAGADLAAARTCERLVFGRYYGNTAQQLAAAYDPYEQDTSFGGVFSTDGKAVGAVRVLRGVRTGLKTLDDAAAHPWFLSAEATRAADIRRSHSWDVASFGVDALGARGWSQQVTMALFSVLFGAFRDNGVESFVGILDSDARRPLAALGVEMIDLPGAYPAPYLGSPASVPVYRHVQDLHEMHSVRFARVHEQVFHGRNIPGLDPVMAVPGTFTLPPAARPAGVADGAG